MRRTSTLISPLPPDARELAVLEHAQQLGLHGRRHVADLVEEERAAVGLLEAAAAPLGAAPENAPFSWPNSSLSTSSAGTAAQFIFTNGPARRGERSCTRARDQLLAGAVLARG